MPKIRFSIVITCCNQRDFIRAAVDSALLQDHRLREIIVVDDGSTDGSRDIVAEYGDLIKFLPLANNRGAIEARNLGALRANGEYIVFLDGDDLLMPWALDVYERIIKEKNPKLIIGQVFRFDGAIPRAEEQKVPGKIELFEYDNFMSKDRTVGLFASAFVVDRQAFEDAGRWTPGIFHLDLQDMYSKLGYSGRTILISSPFTAFYRIHAGNSIHTVSPFLHMASRLLDKEKRGEYPGGRKRRYERRAWLGGQIMFCIKRARIARLYKEAVKLAVSAWPTILVACVRKSIIRIKGHRPVQTLEFHAMENSRVIGEPVSQLGNAAN